MRRLRLGRSVEEIQRREGLEQHGGYLLEEGCVAPEGPRERLVDSPARRLPGGRAARLASGDPVTLHRAMDADERARELSARLPRKTGAPGRRDG